MIGYLQILNGNDITIESRNSPGAPERVQTFWVILQSKTEIARVRPGFLKLVR